MSDWLERCWVRHQVKGSLFAGLGGLAIAWLVLSHEVVGDDASRALNSLGDTAGASGFASQSEWAARVEELSAQAQHAMEERRWQDAATLYEQANALAPDNVNVLANWAVALDWLGRHEEALARLDLAILLAPGGGYLHFLRGAELEKLGALEKAENSYRRAIRSRPSDWRNHMALAELLRGMDRTTEALQVFVEATESRFFENDNGRAGSTSNQLAMWQKIADALVAIRSDFRSGVHTVPPDPPLEEWFDRFEGSARSSPAPAEALTILAETALEMEYFARAALLARQALHYEPGHSPAAVVYGAAKIRVGQATDALEVLREAQRLAPSEIAVAETFGDVLFALSRFDEAAEQYRGALDLNSENVELQRKLETTLIAKGGASKVGGAQDRRER